MAERRVLPFGAAALLFSACHPGPTGGGAPAQRTAAKPPVVAGRPEILPPASVIAAAPEKAAAPVAAPPLDRCPIGTNLDAFADFVVEWPLVDAFKRSREWISGSDSRWEDHRPLALDEDGFVRKLLPGQIARSLLFWSEHSHRPSGDYVVTYEGDGDLDFWNTGKIVERARGRYVVHVADGDLGIAVNLRRTNPANPLRDIHVFMPGGTCKNDENTACRSDADCGGAACIPYALGARTAFHPDFLRGLSPYGVVRFMDWMATNGSKDRAWNDRPKPSDARYTVHGVPVEIMVDLTNRLGADPWFTIPHLADDEYVRNFAEYVARNSKSRRVYVEFSNEIWNGEFPQAEYAQAEGKRLGLSPDPFVARLRWYSRRAVAVFRIFERAFGGTDRLVRVMGSQAANPFVSETVLGYEAARQHTDALAVAPYFGGELGRPEFEPQVKGLTLDQLMAELAGPATERAAEWVSQQAAVAKKFGVKLVTYEGGQHLVGVGPLVDDAATNALFDAANRDGRMKDVYLRYLGEWRARGGELFVHFTSLSGYGRYGRWGAVERVGEHRTEAPKLDALMTYAEQNALPSPR